MSKKRLDVAFPLDTYEQIRALAIATNQPVHHKSGEVMLTPVVVNLVNLGLEKIKEEGIDYLSECLSDKISDTDVVSEKKLRDSLAVLRLEMNKKIDELRELILASATYPIGTDTTTQEERGAVAIAYGEAKPIDIIDIEEEPESVAVSQQVESQDTTPEEGSISALQPLETLQDATTPPLPELPLVASEMKAQDNIKPLLSGLKKIKTNGISETAASEEVTEEAIAMPTTTTETADDARIIGWENLMEHYEKKTGAKFEGSENTFKNHVNKQKIVLTELGLTSNEPTMVPRPGGGRPQPCWFVAQ